MKAPLSLEREIKVKVRVTELAPDVFAYLRKLDGIDQQKIYDSLAPVKNLKAAKRAGES